MRIHNIADVYAPGMLLAPGSYDVEVSRDGFKAWRQSVDLADSDLMVSPTLERQEPTPRIPAELARLMPRMVVIPAGRFSMGCGADPACEDDEKPTHEVSVPSFRLAESEVTVGLFEAFARATGYVSDAEKDAGNLEGCYSMKADYSGWERVKGRSWRAPGFEQEKDHPVVCMSWNDTKAFIEWLRERTQDATYRLPTEAGSNMPFARVPRRSIPGG
ncbi:MAG: SUMF1/EgtB/PvdO family nonheme iron enzyme [Pseudomonadales bacterium]